VDLLTCDLESFYDKQFSLKKLTTEEYIRDDQFEVIGVAVKVNDGDTQWFSGTHEEIKAWLQQFDWANSMMLAHNCAFDAAILHWRFGIKAKAYADTMSMGNALGDGAGSVSLDALSKRYELGEKGTEVVNALGKRRLDFTPEELARYGEYCINDVNLCYLLFQIMLAKEFPKAELKLVDLTLRMFVEPVFELDLPLLEIHLEHVLHKKAKLLQALEGVERTTLMSNPQFADLLRARGVEPPMKMSPTTGKETYAFAKTDEEFRALLEHEDVYVQALVAARLGTKSTIEETRTQRMIDISKRGKLPVPIKYCGARTKRWSGEGGGINMQNLPRTSPIKQAIKAPEGHSIVGVDLSNIELRVGLWFGGMKDKLDQLRNGLDLYKDFASLVFEVPYADVDKEQRFIGKTSQLSLIYGVGAAKLRQAIKTGARMDIGEEAAKRIVDLYRAQYSGVVNAWTQGEKALRAILNDQHMRFGPIEVCGRDGLLLPSGLYMQYPMLRRTTTGWEYKVRNGWEHIYGAKLYQGSIQALARCVMGDGMLRTKKTVPDLPIALTIHDASYMVVPDLLAEVTMEQMIADLCVPPSWAPDLPLAAEGGFGKTLFDC
jgi:DNA polymerase I-like protein with 3'-5' exonuclease and polymerase domains